MKKKNSARNVRRKKVRQPGPPPVINWVKAKRRHERRMVMRLNLVINRMQDMHAKPYCYGQTPASTRHLPAAIEKIQKKFRNLLKGDFAGQALALETEAADQMVGAV